MGFAVTLGRMGFGGVGEWGCKKGSGGKVNNGMGCKEFIFG